MKTKSLEVIARVFIEDINSHYTAFLDMTCFNLKCLQQNDGIDEGFVENQTYFIEACNDLLFDLTNGTDVETAMNNFCGTSSGNSQDALEMIAEWTDQLIIVLRNAKHYLDQRADLNADQKRKRAFRIEETARQTHQLLRALRAHYSTKREHALAA